jgi:hypothetical protein
LLRRIDDCHVTRKSQKFICVIRILKRTSPKGLHITKAICTEYKWALKVLKVHNPPAHHDQIHHSTIFYDNGTRIRVQLDDTLTVLFHSLLDTDLQTLSIQFQLCHFKVELISNPVETDHPCMHASMYHYQCSPLTLLSGWRTWPEKNICH